MKKSDIKRLFGIGDFQPDEELKTDEDILKYIQQCINITAVFEDVFHDCADDADSNDNHDIKDVRKKRRENTIDRARLHSLVLDILKQKKYRNGLTARELAKILYAKGLLYEPTRQAIQPRLSELEAEDKVKVVGTKKDTHTNKYVRVYIAT